MHALPRWTPEDQLCGMWLWAFSNCHRIKGQGEAAAATVVVAAASVDQMGFAARVEGVVSRRVSLKYAGWLPQDGPSNRS
jgi:hypothetical protein